MVFITPTVRLADKMARRKSYRGFIDSLRIRVRGGAGGMGTPKYGGIGGKGGDVIVRTTENADLRNVARKYDQLFVKASMGGNSCETCLIGTPGKNHVIEIPPGVIVSNSNHQILGDLNQPEQELVIAKGGPGGCPETGFSGIRGQDHVVRLDLKLIADIGLVGFPNAGKSTLLRAITDAKPKIASYPFTTITPNVGSIRFKDLRMITMADLPGLIEGAHRNVGMGHEFLRHCERTKLLLLVVDIQGFRLNLKHDYRTCLETVVLLNKELELYREYLLDKPALLVVNKMDTEGAWDKFKEIEKSLRNMEETIQQFPEEIRPYKAIKFDDVVPISAKTCPHDVYNLKFTLRKFLDLYAEEELENNEEKLTEDIQKKLVEVTPKFA